MARERKAREYNGFAGAAPSRFRATSNKKMSRAGGGAYKTVRSQAGAWEREPSRRPSCLGPEPAHPVHLLAKVATILLLTTSGLAIADDAEGKPSFDLRATQEKILQQLPKVGPTVVSIEAGGGSGSGVIVSADGLVLTAAHVIDKAKELTIIYPDGRRFRGKALGTYGPGDAGMAQILEGAPHPFAQVAPANSLSVGQTAFAMGHPGGFDLERGSPIRIGHITEIDNNFISLDAPLIGGDSGGPSFDLQGRVIGIHSHINDRVDVNRDGHIAAFHLAWDSMKQGLHDAEHYSKAVQTQPEKAEQNRPGLAPPGTSTEARDRANRLQELAEKSKAGDGKLKIDREELLKLRKQIADQTDALAPTSGSRIQDGWAARWHSTFESHCRKLSDSVVKVMSNGRQSALATVVSTDGFFITKASEVKNRQIQLQLEIEASATAPKLLPAKVVAIDEGLDLALLKIDPPVTDLSGSLKPIDWSTTNEAVPKGSLCAAVGVDSWPVGFGIISVPKRSLDGKSGAFLGVSVEPIDIGLRVKEIKPRSPALKAGLKVGDVICAAEANKLENADQLSKLVATMLPGESLRLDVQRDETLLTVTVKLADGTQLAPMPGNREQAIDSLTAKLSKRRWGFRSGLQHDCSIAANDCGGPLIDLDGKLIGINIARSGRIQSFAIPIDEVKQFVQRSLAQGDAR